MTAFASVDEILDYAIAREEEAAEFYRGLAAGSVSSQMAKVFSDFAKEEDGHKAKLLKVKAGKTLRVSEKKVLDLKIGDYLVDVEVKPTMDYQEALIVAMKREKMSFKMYTDLAARADDERVKEIFLGLAQEEAKHKLRFEIEYDDNILQEN